jgi:hypothetical protein
MKSIPPYREQAGCLTGAILAIPLTLGLKKIVAKNSGEEQLATASSG